ncbi:hypothetical protein [Chishuiella sp.]|uniref:hypothetical protein n=1 Tax=Chishuiella sp. TaxID=1969467 RepID=UPI0028AC8A67|nr:hypothetical protein [Chishuiella sp.]
MKKNYVIIILLGLTKISAQVGINIESPTNTLDVNGDVRIRSLAEQTTSPTYVLVPDDNGVVNKVSADNLNSGIVTDDSGSSIKKIQTLNYDTTKTVINGLFEFRISGTANATTGNMSYDIRMTKDPGSNVILTAATVNRWGGTGSTTPGAENKTISFTSSNYSNWQTLNTVTGNLNGHNVMLSVNLGSSTLAEDSPYIFYNLIVQRVDGGLKSLIINRY